MLDDSELLKMKELIQPDGGLYCLGWYLAWTPGNKTATLDAEFTSDELRWIADYMDAHSSDGQ
jgi:hypothetical protein